MENPEKHRDEIIDILIKENSSFEDKKNKIISNIQTTKINKREKKKISHPESYINISNKEKINKEVNKIMTEVFKVISNKFENNKQNKLYKFSSKVSNFLNNIIINTELQKIEKEIDTNYPSYHPFLSDLKIEISFVNRHLENTKVSDKKYLSQILQKILESKYKNRINFKTNKIVKVSEWEKERTNLEKEYLITLINEIQKNDYTKNIVQ